MRNVRGNLTDGAKDEIEHDPDGFERHMSVVRSEATAKTYAKGVRKFIEFLEEVDSPLEKAPRGFLGDFVTWMSAKEGLSASTLGLFSVAVRRYLDWMRDRGAPVPEFKTPDVPKIVDADVKVLSEQQIDIYIGLIAKEIHEPTRTALMLLPFTGMRSLEMCSLKMEHIKRQTDDKGKPFALFRFPGKGQKSRLVPVAKRGEKILTEYLLSYRNSFPHKNIYLFPGYIKGSHLPTRTMRSDVEYIRKLMGVPFLTAHTLRKTYASELSKQGFAIQYIAKVLGHSSINTTNQHYLNIPDEELIKMRRVKIGSDRERTTNR